MTAPPRPAPATPLRPVKRPRAATTAVPLRRMRELRIRAGLTQAQLAAASLRCCTSYRDIESGKQFPWPEDFRLIAAALSAGLDRPVTVDELLGMPAKAPAAGEETPPSTPSRAQQRQQGRTR